VLDPNHLLKLPEAGLQTETARSRRHFCVVNSAWPARAFVPELSDAQRGGSPSLLSPIWSAVPGLSKLMPNSERRFFDVWLETPAVEPTQPEPLSSQPAQWESQVS